MKILQTALTTFALSLALTACGGTADTTADDPAPAATPSASAASSSATESPDATDSASAADSANAASGYIDYAAYSADPAAYAAGDVVLFFHAPWCPSCRTTDEALTQEGPPSGLTVVKVDYDSATDLRKSYGVTQQHTFVAIDADGAERGKWSGSASGAEIQKKVAAL